MVQGTGPNYVGIARLQTNLTRTAFNIVDLAIKGEGGIVVGLARTNPATTKRLASAI
jgi:hypothetical protein